MATTAVLDQLTPIFRDIFNNDDLTAVADLTADRVKGWDSLTNIRLFIAIEEKFNVRFNAAEISGLKNVGELADLIERKR